MDLDRQSIEKRDFPIGRRGYDPGAVDAHLEVIAGEVEALRRQARSRRGESLASAASAQVQSIVEAAETSAADIERQAQMEAARIRQDAQREADRTRDEAVEHSRDHVSRVSEATSVMLQRVDAMEGELGALFESLRTGANRLSADLSLLEGNMGELYAAAGGTRRGATVIPAAPEAEGQPIEGGNGTGERPGAGGLLDEEVLTAMPEADPDAEPGTDELAGTEARSVPAFETAAGGGEIDEEPGGDAAVPPSDDAEGARLIALNMALNGQSREDADRYLAENFELADRSALLDEVYASVQG